MAFKIICRLIILCFVVMSSCTVYNCNNRIPKIDGYWISVDDPKNSLIITKDSIFEYYSKELIDASRYYLSKQSCDSRTTGDRYYLTELNNEFVGCYEISVDANNLTFVDLNNPSNRIAYIKNK